MSNDTRTWVIVLAIKDKVTVNKLTRLAAGNPSKGEKADLSRVWSIPADADDVVVSTAATIGAPLRLSVATLGLF